MDETKNRTLMDGVDRGAYVEWRDHAATKLMLGQLAEDIQIIREAILTQAKANLLPDSYKLGLLGAQLGAREALLEVATERSDD